MSTMASAHLRTSGKRGVGDAYHPAQRSNGWREARGLQLREEDGGGELLRLRARGRACVHAKRTERGTGAEPLVNGKGQACYRTLNRRRKALEHYKRDAIMRCPDLYKRLGSARACGGGTKVLSSTLGTMWENESRLLTT